MVVLLAAHQDEQLLLRTLLAYSLACAIIMSNVFVRSDLADVTYSPVIKPQEVSSNLRPSMGPFSSALLRFLRRTSPLELLTLAASKISIVRAPEAHKVRAHSTYVSTGQLHLVHKKRETNSPLPCTRQEQHMGRHVRHPALELWRHPRCLRNARPKCV